MSEERFAGVDWASEEHAICVVDENGRIVEGRRYRHDEAGIQALCARLVRLAAVRVAIERPDGLLIAPAVLEQNCCSPAGSPHVRQTRTS